MSDRPKILPKCVPIMNRLRNVLQTEMYSRVLMHASRMSGDIVAVADAIETARGECDQLQDALMSKKTRHQSLQEVLVKMRAEHTDLEALILREKEALREACRERESVCQELRELNERIFEEATSLGKTAEAMKNSAKSRALILEDAARMRLEQCALLEDVSSADDRRLRRLPGSLSYGGEDDEDAEEEYDDDDDDDPRRRRRDSC